MKTQQGSMRPRSAAAPMARAGVIAANIHWKIAKRRSGDGIVDDCCPDKDEDATGEHAATFSCGADGESGSNCREHTLENSEEEIRRWDRRRLLPRQR